VTSWFPIVAGRAPQNLRRHTARNLLVKPPIEAGAEDDPISLAEGNASRPATESTHRAAKGNMR
jgi:hypothetical protein